jgi:hypothetical protein
VYRRKDDPTLKLDRDTRRRVRRAVREGVAVQDPREAPYAVAYAQLVASRSHTIPLGIRPFLALLAMAAVVIVLTTGSAFRLIWLLAFAVAALVHPLQVRKLARAKAAEAANRETALVMGIPLLEYRPPKATWGGVSPTAYVLAFALLIGIHLVVAHGTGGDEAGLPPPTPEPTPVAANPSWYGLARKECARAHQPRSVTADKIWNADPPPEANGALIHLGASERAEAKGDERLAKREATIAGFLFRELGLPSCARAFG